MTISEFQDHISNLLDAQIRSAESIASGKVNQDALVTIVNEMNVIIGEFTRLREIEKRYGLMK